MKQHRYSAVTKQEARRLYAGGASLRAVAEQLGCGPATVWRWLGTATRTRQATARRNHLALAPGAVAFIAGLRLAGARVGRDARLRFTVPHFAASWLPTLVAELRSYGLRVRTKGRSLVTAQYQLLRTLPVVTTRRALTVWLWARATVLRLPQGYVYLRAYCAQPATALQALCSDYAMQPRLHGKRVALHTTGDLRTVAALLRPFAPTHVVALLRRLH